MTYILIPSYEPNKKLINLITELKKKTSNILVIDDGSGELFASIYEEIESMRITVVKHEVNQGKGAAIQTAKKLLKGDIVIIQDGDLEYEPNDYNKLLKAIYEGHDVVYGSRVLGKNRYLLKNFSSVLRIFSNHLLTIISNILNAQNLTDAHTCYKMFKSDIFLKIKLKEKGFSFCPEITTKIGLKKIKIKEVPIKYFGRGYNEGKKINFMDGIKAILTLIKYRFFV